MEFQISINFLFNHLRSMVLTTSVIKRATSAVSNTLLRARILCVDSTDGHSTYLKVSAKNQLSRAFKLSIMRLPNHEKSFLSLPVIYLNRNSESSQSLVAYGFTIFVLRQSQMRSIARFETISMFSDARKIFQQPIICSAYSSSLQVFYSHRCTAQLRTHAVCLFRGRSLMK